DKQLAVIPAHIDHGVVATAPTVIVGTMLAGTGIGTLVPLRERDLAAADGKGRGNRDRALRLLVRRIVGNHNKLTCRHHNKLRAIRTVAARIARLGGGLHQAAGSSWTGRIWVGTLRNLLVFHISA